MTLVIGLIMLIMISMAAVVSYNVAKTNLDIVGNLQFSNQALGSADSVIQEALSTTRMFETPNTVFLNPCTVANSRCFDMNNDGQTDITVVLAPPTCVKAQNIPNQAFANDFLPSASLVSRQEALSCTTSEAQERLATVGSATGESLCSETVWDLVATATDNGTGASITITQGAAVRVTKDNLNASCI